jgi:hypothetical protein
VNWLAPPRGVRLRHYRYSTRRGRHRKADPYSSLSPPTQAQPHPVCTSARD